MEAGIAVGFAMVVPAALISLAVLLRRPRRRSAGGLSEPDVINPAVSRVGRSLRTEAFLCRSLRR